ncbi:hypothetical protein HK102_010777 [Quaeritorhiza haematococci]|nr:hypothetical protein HK102_010777 [Quaeritorhiza haematococci]
MDIVKHPQLIKDLRRSAQNNPAIAQCFKNVRFANAGLSEEEDAYPLGASRMFFRIFGLRSVASSYDSFYYMEPDNIPCRPYWLDRLYEESIIPGDFWVRGSVIRDGNPMAEVASYAEHINGNAFYQLRDGQFVEFIKRVEAAFWEDTAAYIDSYDIALYLLRKDRKFYSWAEYTSTLHLWQYTSTVQNWYRTFVNATELCNAETPHLTYLVHGRGVVY